MSADLAHDAWIDVTRRALDAVGERIPGMSACEAAAVARALSAIAVWLEGELKVPPAELPLLLAGALNTDGDA